MGDSKDFIKSPIIYDLFAFRNRICEIRRTPDYTNDGRELHYLKCRPMDKYAIFAFRAGDGLIIKVYEDKDGKQSIPRFQEEKENNLINEINSMQFKDPYDLENFIKRYGFFFSLPENEFTRIDLDQTVVFLKRFQNLCTLARLLNLKHVDYGSLLELVSEILLNEPPRLEIGPHGIISGCSHPFTEKFLNADKLKLDYLRSRYPDVNLDIALYDYDYSGPYYIPDTFTDKNGDISDDAEPPWGGYGTSKVVDGSPSDMVGISELKDIFELYRYISTDNKPLRIVTDFFYHLFNTYVDELHFIKTEFGRSISADLAEHFDENFRNGLLNVARIVFKEELDHVLKNIHPVLDPVSMMPNLDVQDLFSAIYLSLFYAQRYPYKAEIPMSCKKCGKIFYVNSTTKRKLYCSLACQNAAAQARHRKKYSLLSLYVGKWKPLYAEILEYGIHKTYFYSNDIEIKESDGNARVEEDGLHLTIEKTEWTFNLKTDHGIKKLVSEMGVFVRSEDYEIAFKKMFVHVRLDENNVDHYIGKPEYIGRFYIKYVGGDSYLTDTYKISSPPFINQGLIRLTQKDASFQLYFKNPFPDLYFVPCDLILNINWAQTGELKFERFGKASGEIWYVRKEYVDSIKEESCNSRRITFTDGFSDVFLVSNTSGTNLAVTDLEV